VLDLTVKDADVQHHAFVVVVLAVKDQGAQLAHLLRGWRRQALNDAVEEFMDSLAGLGAHGQAVFSSQTKNLLNFHRHLVRIGSWQVDLIDDRNQREIVADREVCVGHGLRLHALRGVNHQNGTFTRFEGAAHFVSEVNVAGGIDEVEFVVLILVAMGHRNGGCLDGDAAFALKIHGVQHLRSRLAGADGLGGLEEAICKGALAVVDVGDDGEVADAHVGLWAWLPGRSGAAGKVLKSSAARGDLNRIPGKRRGRRAGPVAPGDARRQGRSDTHERRVPRAQRGGSPPWPP